MALAPYLRPELVFVFDSVGTRDELFTRVSSAVARLYPGADPDGLVQHLIERETQMPTSTPEGVAFPHALAAELDSMTVAAAKIVNGVHFGAASHPPSTLAFFTFGPTRDPWEHIRLLARMARIVRPAEARARLRAATTAADLYARLMAEDRTHG